MRLDSIIQADQRRERGAWMDSQKIPGLKLQVRGLRSASHEAALEEFWKNANEAHRALPDINDQAQRFVIEKSLLVGWNLEDEFTSETVRQACETKLFRDEVVDLAAEVTARGRDALDAQTKNS